MSFYECLKAACQRGVYHVASQTLALVGPVAVLASQVTPRWSDASRPVGGLAFALLAASLMLFGFTLQPSFTAGKPRFWRAVRDSIQATNMHFGRALSFVVLRSSLLIFAVLNLHLFGQFGLWVAEDLAGLDVAYLGVLCSLGNSAYLLILVLVAWCLLTPFNEALSYLFFVDVRTRQEGLDLWQRVQDLFPASSPQEQTKESGSRVAKVSAAGLLLAFGFLLPTPTTAQEPLAAVQAARHDIGVIRHEVKEADPYPGGMRWLGQLEVIADQLERSTPKPTSFRWFRQGLKGFARLKQSEAVARLDDLDAQLAIIEESMSRPRQAVPNGTSRDEIRGLIPPEKRHVKTKKTKTIEEKKKVEDDRDNVDNVDRVDPGFGKPVGPGIVGPTAIGGAANILLVLLLGLGTAAVLATIVYLVYAWWLSRTKDKPRQSGPSSQSADDGLEDPTQQDPARLWRQADEHARAGDYLAAVRTLYLAVLSVLHRGGLIRYERPRTNGEYADQLRRRPPIHRPFLSLTSLFEVKWYGQRSCEPNDYHTCRELAEQVRLGSVGPA